MSEKWGSEAEYQDLKNLGFAVLRNRVDAAGCESALRWLEMTESQGPPASMEPEYEAQAADHQPRLRKLRRLLWNDERFWAEWLTQSSIPGIAAKTVGTNARLIFNAAFMKPARFGSRVLFHQDQGLWSRQYPRAVSIWLALSECHESNGCLIGFPGSHQNGLIRHHGAADRDRYIDVSTCELAPPTNIVLDPGDVVIWDRYFVHGSGQNSSGDDRRGIVFVFADAAVPGFVARDSYSFPRDGNDRS